MNHRVREDQQGMIMCLGVMVFVNSIRSGGRVAINRDCDLPKAKRGN